MRRLIFIALFLNTMGALASQNAFAQAGASSSSGGKSAAGVNGLKEIHMSAGYLGISSASSQFDLAPGYDYKPFPSMNWLQLGGEITYQKISEQGGSASNILILAGPTVGLGPVTGDAFFLSLGLALKSGSSSASDASSAAASSSSSSTTTTNPNGFGFYFLVGKRIPLAGNFSLRPSLGVIATGTTGMVFRPFALSYLF